MDRRRAGIAGLVFMLILVGFTARAYFGGGGPLEGYPGHLSSDVTTGTLAQGKKLYLQLGENTVMLDGVRGDAVGRTVTLVRHRRRINVDDSELYSTPFRIEIDGGPLRNPPRVHLITDPYRFGRAPDDYVFCSWSDRIPGAMPGPGYGIAATRDSDRRIGRLQTATVGGHLRHAEVPYAVGPVYFVMKTGRQNIR